MCELVMKTIGAYTGLVIDRIMNIYYLKNQQEVESKCLEFCNEICGVRDRKYLSISIEQKLANSLNFENACGLFYLDKRLFTMRCFQNIHGEFISEVLIEIPSSIGLTGKAIKKHTKIFSTYGNADINFENHIDNVLKLKRIRNIVIIPLYIGRGTLDSMNNKKEPELVGVLHLINYKLDDIKTINEVLTIIINREN